MPGQQGGGRHAEGCPGRTGEQATEDSQQGAIGGFVGTTPHLAPKYLHFIAQGEELDLLRPLGAKRQKEQVEHATNSEVDEGPQLASGPAPSQRIDGSRED